MLQLPSPSSWTVLRKSGASLKRSASHVPTEEAHEPTCMPAPAEQQCRCSPNKPSAPCTAARGEGSNPGWLSRPRQDTLKSVWHQPTFPKSCSDAPQMCSHSSHPTAKHSAHWYHSLQTGIGLGMQISWARFCSGRPAVLLPPLDLDCPENPWQILTHPL